MRLINDEALEQRRYVDHLFDLLSRLQARLAAAGGDMAVLDTNVLLHYQPVEQVKWPEVLGIAPVRLVLPLRVVEELDMRKYGFNSTIAERARRLLSQLWSLLETTAGNPVELPGRPGVTIEVPIEDGPRRRTLDANEEILNECHGLKAAGQSVTLVTGDTGMSLRATARSIPVKAMPEFYLRERASQAKRGLGTN